MTQSADRPSDPMVVFTHGWGDDATSWDAQVDALSAVGHVIRWDLLGHGRHDRPVDPTAYSRAQVLADLDALVGRTSAVLVGHSFGGQLSLEFAVRWPERVLGLGLLATGPGVRDPDVRARWNAEVERQASTLDDPVDAATLRAYGSLEDPSALMDLIPSLTMPATVVVGA